MGKVGIQMRLLEERILRDGRALSEDVLLVDSFLNHQVDTELMRAVGNEFARLFKDAGVTRVATIEASGIAPAVSLSSSEIMSRRKTARPRGFQSSPEA